MYQKFNISLRLPIHLFLNQKSEEMVVEKLKECYSKINTSWMLKVWMDPNIINPNKVMDFAAKYEDIFKHRTSFKPKDKIDANDYVLFEIVDPNNTLPNQEKFNRSRYIYHTQIGESIPKGLDEYIKISNFILSVNQRKAYETSRPLR
jgi:hypothetical protein